MLWPHGWGRSRSNLSERTAALLATRHSVVGRRRKRAIRLCLAGTSALNGLYYHVPQSPTGTVQGSPRIPAWRVLPAGRLIPSRGVATRTGKGKGRGGGPSIGVIFRLPLRNPGYPTEIA